MKYALIFIAIVINTSCSIGKSVNYIVDHNAEIDINQEYWINIKQNFVKVQLYYECFCPLCRQFDSGLFAYTVKKLGQYLDIHTYPYGNANTTVYENGTIEFECQHGPAECYGNKLHACALALLRNLTEALLYNSCMMDLKFKQGSDDHAADECGKSMGIDSTPIKTCAKSEQGTTLLYNYGVESKKVGYQHVPHILINGVQTTADNFPEDLCNAFDIPPPPCNKLDNTYRTIINHI